MSNIFEDWGFTQQNPPPNNDGGCIVMALMAVAALALYGLVKLVGG